MGIVMFRVTLPAVILAASFALEAADSSVSVSVAGNRAAPAVIVSRVFAEGEIRGFARPLIAGADPSPWQCDARTRWEDGSLQHALISFPLPAGRGSPVKVSFADSPHPCSGGDAAACPELGLSLSGMLGFQNGTWGGVLEARQGSSVFRTDVRAMLQGGSFTYLMRGPVVTQVLVEDAGPGRKQDFGWKCVSGCGGDYTGASWEPDPVHRSLHPRFIVTFLRDWNGVRVDPMIENHWSTALQDQRYALEVRGGRDGIRSVRSLAEFSHYARTRRSEGLSYWDGPPPPEVDIDYNFPYMVLSRVLPPYDVKRVVGSGAVAKEVEAFRKRDCSFNGPCQFTKAFSTTGGRGEIGLFPRWDTRYLYTFHPDLKEVTLANARTSEWIPVHYRESEPGLAFVDADEDGSARDDNIDAYGRVVSVDAREPFISRFPKGIQPVAELSAGHGWRVDLAHQAAFAVVGYLVTGDYYLLEEIQYWAAFDVAHSDNTDCHYCRHSDWGYLNEASAQVRGKGWALRNVALAGFLSWGPERIYFRQKVKYNAAVLEGFLGITDGEFYDDRRHGAKWSWGRRVLAFGRENPLAFLSKPNMRTTSRSVDETKACSVIGQFQQHYAMVAHAYVYRLGYTMLKSVVERQFRLLATQFQDERTFNRYLAAEYVLPCTANPARGGTACKSDDEANEYFTSAADVQDAYTPETRRDAEDNFEMRSGDVENGYPWDLWAAAAMHYSYTYGGVSGADVCRWLSSRIRTQDLLGSNRSSCGNTSVSHCDNPKWALAPWDRSDMPADSRDRGSESAPGAIRPAPGRGR